MSSVSMQVLKTADGQIIGAGNDLLPDANGDLQINLPGGSYDRWRFRYFTLALTGVWTVQIAEQYAPSDAWATGLQGGPSLYPVDVGTDALPILPAVTAPAIISFPVLDALHASQAVDPSGKVVGPITTSIAFRGGTDIEISSAYFDLFRYRA